MAVDPQYELMERLDKHLDETLNRFDASRAPIWESQAEIGKNLVSLASGSLVISITWVQFLATKVPHPRWAGLLVVAWILFGLTVLLAASRQGWSGRARTFRLRFEEQRGDLRAEVAAIDDAGGTSEDIDAAIGKAIARASVSPAKAVRIYNGISHVMLWSFTAGLICLLTFALTNPPF